MEKRGPTLLIGPAYSVEHREKLSALIAQFPRIAQQLAILTDEETAQLFRTAQTGQGPLPWIFTNPVDAALLLPAGTIQVVGEEGEPQLKEFARFRSAGDTPLLLSLKRFELLLEQLLANLQGIPLDALSDEDKETALRLSQVLAQFK